VPENFRYVEALGAALLARESGKKSTVKELAASDARQTHWKMPKLDKVTQQDKWVAPKIDKPFTGYLGVDVGSTSTKAVILDESGKTVMAKNYLMTRCRR
jgi:activator of 2-hydroxyglutaryl-CoA dehydratase